MRRALKATTLLGAFVAVTFAGEGRFSVELQSGSSFIGAGSAPSFWLGFYHLPLDSSRFLSGDYTAVISRATFFRGSLSYRMLRSVSFVASMEVALPVGHMEKTEERLVAGSTPHTYRSVSYRTVKSDRPGVCTGYLFSPGFGVRWSPMSWRVQPYFELDQGYMWRQMDIWWDPTGLSLSPPPMLRIHHRDRISRAFMRASVGALYPLSSSVRALLAVEWTSARNDPGGWYFLDWQDVHQRFDVSLGVSYAF